MKLITRNTDYAIRALCFIAQQGKNIIPISSLAKSLKIPKPFLRKIFQILSIKGFLKSYKGRGGGFYLAVEPSRIFIIDIMKIFQGPLKLNKCMLKKEVCPEIKSCPLKKKLDKIEKIIFSELKYISIYSLVDRDN